MNLEKSNLTAGFRFMSNLILTVFSLVPKVYCSCVYLLLCSSTTRTGKAILVLLRFMISRLKVIKFTILFCNECMNQRNLVVANLGKSYIWTSLLEHTAKFVMWTVLVKKGDAETSDICTNGGGAQAVLWSKWGFSNKETYESTHWIKYSDKDFN